MKKMRKLIATMMAIAMMVSSAAFAEEAMPTQAPAVEESASTVYVEPAADVQDEPDASPAPAAEVPAGEAAVVEETAAETEVPAGEPAVEPEVSAEEPAIEPEAPAEEPEIPAGEPAVVEEPAEEPAAEPEVETEVPAEEPAAEPEVPAEEPAAEPEVPAEEPAAEPEVPAEEPAAEPEVPAEEPAAEPEVEPEVPAEEPAAEPEVPAEEPAAEPEAPVEETPAPSQAPAEEPAPTQEPVQEEAAEPVSTEGLRKIIVTLKEGETELPLYAEVGGEVLASIPAGSVLYVKSIEASWSYAVYGEIAGYVNTASIALFNSEATEEEQQIIRTVTVSANVGSSVTHEGDQIVLSAKLTGFDDVSYLLQWQYSPDGGATIVDIGGANGDQYSFTINDENAAYLWRVCVTILETTEEAAE